MSAAVATGAPLRLAGPARAARSVAARAAALGALVAVEVLLALGVAGSSLDAELLAVAILASLAIAACVLAPWPTLLVLAALWAPTHVILADFHLAGVHGLDLTLSRLLGLLVLLGFGCYLLASAREEQPPLPYGLRALLVFLGLFALAAAISSSADGLTDLIRVASGIVIALAAFRVVDSGRRLLTLASVVTAGGVVVAAVTITQFALVRTNPGLAHALFGESFYARSYDVGDPSASAVRVFGPLGGAGETAGALLVAFVFALARYSLLRDRGPRATGVVALLVIAAGLLATLTRAATVALLVVLLAWALQRQLRTLSTAALRFRLAVLVSGVALLTLPVIGARELQSRFSDVNPQASGSSFAQGRGEIWSKEVTLIRDGGPLDVVLGRGAHASYVRVPQPEDPTARQSPHNLLLWLVVETGAAGAIAYLLFVGGSAAAFLTASRSGRFTPRGQIAAVGLAALAAYSVLDLFLLTVPSPGHRWYFMLFVGAALRLAMTDGEGEAA